MKRRDDPEAMRAYRRKYNSSEKGREARRRYAATPKGQEALRISKARYNKVNAADIRRAQQAIKRRNMQRVNDIKIERGCADCGYTANAWALDFDHLVPGQKKASISQLITGHSSWNVIAAEIAKCEVVCANCHRIRTFTRRDHLRQVDRPSAATPPPTLFEDAI